MISWALNFPRDSFTKIMTDEAVSSWRLDIHKCILKNCEKLVQLICSKLQVSVDSLDTVPPPFDTSTSCGMLPGTY
jgi:hypothetical protein